MIQIARDGEILGHVELAQIPDALAQGTVLVTDHYWAEGMPEWRLVEELAPTPAVNQDVVGQVESSAELVESANDKRDWRNDPATAKQIAFLESLGLGVTGPITKGEASDLIDKYKDSPEAQAYKLAKWEKEQEAERIRRSDFPSFHLKVDIDHVCSEMERVKELPCWIVRNMSAGESSSKNKANWQTIQMRQLLLKKKFVNSGPPAFVTLMDSEWNSPT